MTDKIPLFRIPTRDGGREGALESREGERAVSQSEVGYRCQEAVNLYFSQSRCWMTIIPSRPRRTHVGFNVLTYELRDGMYTVQYMYTQTALGLF